MRTWEGFVPKRKNLVFLVHSINTVFRDMCDLDPSRTTNLFTIFRKWISKNTITSLIRLCWIFLPPKKPPPALLSSVFSSRPCPARPPPLAWRSTRSKRRRKRSRWRRSNRRRWRRGVRWVRRVGEAQWVAGGKKRPLLGFGFLVIFYFWPY